MIVKQKIVSFLLVPAICAALCVPAFAQEPPSERKSYVQLPAIEPQTPSGYRYKYTIEQNSNVDSMLIGGVLTAFGFAAMPTAAAAAAAGISINILQSLDGSNVPSCYTDYVYECEDPGIYPYIDWHKYKYVIEADIDGDGEAEEVVNWNDAYEYALLPRSVDTGTADNPS